MRSGIYRIINSVNGNIYIGSSVDLIRRRKQHFIALLNNKHFNNHLQSAYNKYGECNFEFEVIENIDFCEDLQEKLLEREQYYLDLLKPEYNICRIAGSFGMQHTEETKHKISDSTKGVKKSKEHAYNIGNAQRGKSLTDEHKQKLSDSAKNRKSVSHKSSIVIDGITYDSIKIASELTGIKYNAIQRNLRNPNLENYSYVNTKEIKPKKDSIKKGLSFKNTPVIIDNIEYNSAYIASKILDIKADTVKYRIASPNFTNYKFK